MVRAFMQGVTFNGHDEARTPGMPATIHAGRGGRCRLRSERVGTLDYHQSSFDRLASDATEVVAVELQCGTSSKGGR